MKKTRVYIYCYSLLFLAISSPALAECKRTICYQNICKEFVFPDDMCISSPSSSHELATLELLSVKL